jgi:hypothetical protein
MRVHFERLVSPTGLSRDDVGLLLETAEPACECASSPLIATSAGGHRVAALQCHLSHGVVVAWIKDVCSRVQVSVEHIPRASTAILIFRCSSTPSANVRPSAVHKFVDSQALGFVCKSAERSDLAEREIVAVAQAQLSPALDVQIGER